MTAVQSSVVANKKQCLILRCQTSSVPGYPSCLSTVRWGKDLSHIFSLLFVSLFSHTYKCCSGSRRLLLDDLELREMPWHAFFWHILAHDRDRWGTKFSSNTEWWLEGILGGCVVPVPRKCKSNSKGLQRNLSSSEYLQGWRFHNYPGPLFQYSIKFTLKKKFF